MNKFLVLILTCLFTAGTAVANPTAVRNGCVQETRDTLGDDIDTDLFQEYVQECVDSYAEDDDEFIEDDDEVVEDDLDTTEESAEVSLYD